MGDCRIPKQVVPYLTIDKESVRINTSQSGYQLVLLKFTSPTALCCLLLTIANLAAWVQINRSVGITFRMFNTM